MKCVHSFVKSSKDKRNSEESALFCRYGCTSNSSMDGLFAGSLSKHHFNTSTTCGSEGTPGKLIWYWGEEMATNFLLRPRMEEKGVEP